MSQLHSSTRPESRKHFPVLQYMRSLLFTICSHRPSALNHTDDRLWFAPVNISTSIPLSIPYNNNSYHARQRPWYKHAAALANSSIPTSIIQWTDPYAFPTWESQWTTHFTITTIIVFMVFWVLICALMALHLVFSPFS